MYLKGSSNPQSIEKLFSNGILDKSQRWYSGLPHCGNSPLRPFSTFLPENLGYLLSLTCFSCFLFFSLVSMVPVSELIHSLTLPVDDNVAGHYPTLNKEENNEKKTESGGGHIEEGNSKPNDDYQSSGKIPISAPPDKTVEPSNDDAQQKV